MLVLSNLELAGSGAQNLLVSVSRSSTASCVLSPKLVFLKMLRSFKFMNLSLAAASMS